jgi:hypothetical protein
MILIALACASPGIPADGYDLSCDEDIECHAVPVGDVCGCTCEYAAINEASLEAWSLERDAYFSTQCEQGDTCDCPEYEAACGSNGCELR